MLSDTIKEIRRKNYLNQTAFAKRIGVSQSAVSQWENDLTRPNSEQLKTISDTFGISVDDILSGEPTQQEKGSAPIYKETRIISGGVDKLPKQQREQVLGVLRAMFSNRPDLFMEGDD